MSLALVQRSVTQPQQNSVRATNITFPEHTWGPLSSIWSIYYLGKLDNIDGQVRASYHFGIVTLGMGIDDGYHFIMRDLDWAEELRNFIS